MDKDKENEEHCYDEHKYDDNKYDEDNDDQFDGYQDELDDKDDDIIFKRIFIFDFDDTIFPTSIIGKNKRIWKGTNNETINDNPQNKLLYETIKNCILYVITLKLRMKIKYGEDNIHFIIFTNANKRWIDDIKGINNSKMYSPFIGKLIVELQDNISIISARDEYMESHNGPFDKDNKRIFIYKIIILNLIIKKMVQYQ